MEIATPRTEKSTLLARGEQTQKDTFGASYEYPYPYTAGARLR